MVETTRSKLSMVKIVCVEIYNYLVQIADEISFKFHQNDEFQDHTVLSEK